MFNLIITIISIALIVVLTATSIFYGGSSYSNGAADAIAATFINQAQQVQASATLYSAQNGGAPADVAALVTDKFLTSNPTAPSQGVWVLDTTSGANPVSYAGTTAVIGAKNEGSNITAEVCVRINDKGSDVVHCEEGADVGAAADAFEARTAALTTADLADSDTVAVIVKL